MIYSLRGNLICIGENYLVIECAGVGYKCLTSANTQKELRNFSGCNDFFSNGSSVEIKLFTHMNIKENAVDLFGFASAEELGCFKMLTSVSGVGPKVALGILSMFTAKQITLFISGNDSESITKVPGVGKKTSQRIVLELRDKLKFFDTNNICDVSGVSMSHKNITEATRALSVLGYNQATIFPVLSSLDSTLPVEDLIRLALKEISNQR